MVKLKGYSTYLKVLIILFLAITINGQGKIDSLKKLLPDAKDLERYTIVSQLSTEYMYIDAVLAIQYAKEALKIALDLNNEKNIADANYKIGFGNYRNADYPVALQNFNTALEIYNKIKEEKSAANTKNFLAIVNSEMKRSDISLALYTELLSYYWEKNQLRDYSIILMNIGTILIEKEEFDRALESFFKVLEIEKQITAKRKDFIANVYCNIGESYFGKKQYDLSLKYQKMSLEIFKEIKLDDGIANLQMDIGLSLIRSKNYALAKDYLTDALKIIR